MHEIFNCSPAVCLIIYWSYLYIHELKKIEIWCLFLYNHVITMSVIYCFHMNWKKNHIFSLISCIDFYSFKIFNKNVKSKKVGRDFLCIHHFFQEWSQFQYSLTTLPMVHESISRHARKIMIWPDCTLRDIFYWYHLDVIDVIHVYGQKMFYHII